MISYSYQRGLRGGAGAGGAADCGCGCDGFGVVVPGSGVREGAAPAARGTAPGPRIGEGPDAEPDAPLPDAAEP